MYEVGVARQDEHQFFVKQESPQLKTETQVRWVAHAEVKEEAAAQPASHAPHAPHASQVTDLNMKELVQKNKRLLEENNDHLANMCDS